MRIRRAALATVGGARGSARRAVRHHDERQLGAVADHDRGVAVAVRGLLHRRAGVRARLPAVGGGPEQEGWPARPPHQPQDPLRRELADAGRHQLQHADRVRPRRARVRALQQPADHAELEGRRALRLRLRRGRRRRPIGIRRRPAQRLRRQRARGAEPDRVREVGRLAAREPAPKTAAYPTVNDPFTQPQLPPAQKIMGRPG